MENPEPPNYYHSAANTFLQKEVYRLGTEPGLSSLPPGPERDFLVLTWGPIVYRTTYAPDTERLIPVFLRALNEEMASNLRRALPGSPEHIRALEKTYASKVFSDPDMYDGLDEEGVRQAFHDWKVSLAVATVELPVRFRVCCVIDDAVLAHLTGQLDLSSIVQKDADLSICPVRVIEENFPDQQLMNSTSNSESPASTLVALRALVELFYGLSQGKCLGDFHRSQKTYLGNGAWS